MEYSFFSIDPNQIPRTPKLEFKLDCDIAPNKDDLFYHNNRWFIVTIRIFSENGIMVVVSETNQVIKLEE